MAWRDPRTPRVVRRPCVALLAYAPSPVDLIPDFIPVLGLLDDLVLLPLGIVLVVALVVALVPRPLWQDCLQRAGQREARLPCWRWEAAAVVLLWLVLTAGAVSGIIAWSR